MIKKGLIELSRKYKVVGWAKRCYKLVRDSLLEFYYGHQKINDHTIVFEAYRSNSYACSPKAIYEQLLNDPAYKNYTFVWSFQDPDAHAFVKGPRTRLVKHESHAYYTAFARAKYWVVNGWIPLNVKKRPGQVALQCWHGTPLKRLRYDIIEDAQTGHRENSLRDNDLDMARYDYFISPSAFTTKVFTSAFNLEALGKKDILIETGYPRNDYLVTHHKADAEAIKKRLGIPADKKILLYAPTWRDDQHVADQGYTYDVDADFSYFQNILSQDYVVLFRAHTLVSSNFDFSKYKGFVYDVSKVDDINELYVISDVLMTDYSSVFFDYAILGRPIIFYMYDKEHYQKDLRGFYLDLNELPGDIVTTTSEVAAILKDLSAYEKKHALRLDTFRKKFNYLEDGKATTRVIKEVFSDV